jgi:hypothetical protein
MIDKPSYKDAFPSSFPETGASVLTSEDATTLDIMTDTVNPEAPTPAEEATFVPEEPYPALADSPYAVSENEEEQAFERGEVPGSRDGGGPGSGTGPIGAPSKQSRRRETPQSNQGEIGHSAGDEDRRA